VYTPDPPRLAQPNRIGGAIVRSQRPSRAADARSSAQLSGPLLEDTVWANTGVPRRDCSGGEGVSGCPTAPVMRAALLWVINLTQSAG
jgi:hypothetical protein